MVEENKTDQKKYCPCSYCDQIEGEEDYCKLIGKRNGKCHYNETFYFDLCVVWIAVNKGVEFTGVPVKEGEVCDVPKE